jgi:uncharacterized phiE125 gp8 family phage protein
MRSLRVITAATVEPVTLEEAKLHLRVDGDSEDTLITALIGAARDYCERFTGLALADQELELTIDSTDQIFLPLAPLDEIATVTKIKDGEETPLVEGVDYWVDDLSMPAQVHLMDLETNVQIMPVDKYTLRIAYSVAPAPIQPMVKAALMLKLGMIYSDRGGENTNQYADEAIDNLLRPYRILFGMA